MSKSIRERERERERNENNLPEQTPTANLREALEVRLLPDSWLTFNSSLLWQVASSLKASEQLKQEGNEFFKQKNFEKSLVSEAIRRI